MKLSTKSLPLLVFAALCCISNLQADRYEQEESCQTQSCCRRECGCNPLFCGALDLQIQAGVMPITWQSRGVVDVLMCTGVPMTNPITHIFTFPKYSTLFRLPFVVGGQIGYAISDNMRVYLELNYGQGRSKTTPTIAAATTPASSFVFTSLSKYKVLDAYVGARYYWDRWCDRFSFFFGGKVGLTHHYNTAFTASSITAGVTTIVIPTGVTPATNLFLRHTVPSGGLNIGLDYCICGDWALAFTAELVASCGPKNNLNIILPTPLVNIGSNLLIGHIGTELRFPLTVALRYIF